MCRRDELARLLTSRSDAVVNIDLGGEGGATPLHLAAAGGWDKCATNLLENNASPVVKNKKGQVGTLRCTRRCWSASWIDNSAVFGVVINAVALIASIARVVGKTSTTKPTTTKKNSKWSKNSNSNAGLTVFPTTH